MPVRGPLDERYPWRRRSLGANPGTRHQGGPSQQCSPPAPSPSRQSWREPPLRPSYAHLDRTLRTLPGVRACARSEMVQTVPQRLDARESPAVLRPYSRRKTEGKGQDPHEHAHKTRASYAAAVLKVQGIEGRSSPLGLHRAGSGAMALSAMPSRASQTPERGSP